jgi:hypothetical protein
MPALYDKSHYYVDFSKNKSLTDEEKVSLEKIQEIYRPVERAVFLMEYYIEGKITEDDYMVCTGIPVSGII